MNLSEYFADARGIGVLGTADSNGKVDMAVYARPHVIDEQTVAFIMSGRLSHQNIESNPNAAYMFVEHGEGYTGKRLYLTRIREETDPEKIDAVRREHRKAAFESGTDRYLVYFHVDRTRPLVGD